MPITANCHCGHQFRVRDEYAGKKAQCPNCGNAMVILLAEGQPSPRPATFMDSVKQGYNREAASQDEIIGGAIFTGFFCFAVSLVFCLLSGFFWVVSLTTIAKWLLWLSWWIVVLLTGLLIMVNWGEFTAKLSLWKRLLSTGASGVLMIAVLWGHDSYYDYLFAPTDSETITASGDKRPTPSHQQSNPHRPLETTQTNLQQLESRREAVQGLLNKTKGDQQQVILQMRRLGITTTQDLKSHPQGRVLVDEFQRLVGEIKGLEMAVVRIEEAMVKTRALIRSIERSQVLGEAGLSDEEIKELSERLMIADEKEDGTSTPVSVDPVQTDALLREALSQKQEDDSVQKDR